MTEQSERFLAAEIVREKLIAQTRDEVPYTTAVVVEAFREEPERNLVVISASIIVERPSQKGILIGERGAAHSRHRQGGTSGARGGLRVPHLPRAPREGRARLEQEPAGAR